MSGGVLQEYLTLTRLADWRAGTRRTRRKEKRTVGINKKDKRDSTQHSSLFTRFGNLANFGKWLGICPFCQCWHFGQMVRYLGDLAMLPFLLNSQVFGDFGNAAISPK